MMLNLMFRQHPNYSRSVNEGKNTTRPLYSLLTRYLDGQPAGSGEVARVTWRSSVCGGRL